MSREDIFVTEQYECRLSFRAEPEAAVPGEIKRAPLPLRIHREACKLNGFRLVKLIGVGPTSRVYLAENLEDTDYKGIPAKVVIKILEWPMVKGDYQRIWLARLLSLYKVLPPHRNVVPIRQIFGEEDSEYIVMDYCPLGSLSWVVRPENASFSRGLAEDKARDFFIQICDGLIHLHYCGLNHGHLTCENIIVTKEYRCMLMDYGHSPGMCKFENLTPTQQLYTAPEILQGAACTAFGGDVWSLGIVLYAMLHGGVPFDVQDIKKSVDKDNLPGVQFRPSLSFSCIRLVKYLLTYCAFMRPTMAEVMEDPWVTGRNDPLVEAFFGKETLATKAKEKKKRQKLVDLSAPKTRALEHYPYQAYPQGHCDTRQSVPSPPYRRLFNAKGNIPVQIFLPGTKVPIVGINKMPPPRVDEFIIGAPQRKTWQEAYDSLLCGDCKSEKEERIVTHPVWLEPLQKKKSSTGFYAQSYGVTKKMAPRVRSVLSFHQPDKDLSLSPGKLPARESPCNYLSLVGNRGSNEDREKGWDAAMAQSEKYRSEFLRYYGGRLPPTCTEFPLPPVTVIGMQRPSLTPPTLMFLAAKEIE